MTYEITVLKKPAIRYLEDDLYILTEALEVEIQYPRYKELNKRLVLVPRGFSTDLASIPKTFQIIYSKANPKSMCPAILHDYMYTGCSVFTRKEADLIFYYFLRHQGFNIVRANFYYIAVHVGGWRFWRNCEKQGE